METTLTLAAVAAPNSGAANQAEAATDILVRGDGVALLEMFLRTLGADAVPALPAPMPTPPAVPLLDVVLGYSDVTIWAYVEQAVVLLRDDFPGTDPVLWTRMAEICRHWRGRADGSVGAMAFLWLAALHEGLMDAMVDEESGVSWIGADATTRRLFGAYVAYWIELIAGHDIVCAPRLALCMRIALAYVRRRPYDEAAKIIQADMMIKPDRMAVEAAPSSDDGRRQRRRRTGDGKSGPRAGRRPNPVPTYH